MKYKYICKKNICYSKDIGEYITYGIALENNGNIQFNDISINKYAVRAFVEKLNKLQLDPIHLLDAIEDFVQSDESI